jgi:hypothetical protein
MPVRFGIKQWMLSPSARYPFYMDAYTGKTGCSKDHSPIRIQILREVLKCLFDLRCHVVFMDFFTLYVLVDIRTLGFRASGTVKKVSKYQLEKMEESD